MSRIAATAQSAPRRSAGRRALLLALAAVPLAACGIRGPNKPPEDADPDYPRSYPPPESVAPEGLRPPQDEQDGTRE